jgi:hypothetical protein
MLATTLAAVLAQAVGVEFVVSHGGELIPLSGIAVMTGFFSVVGVVMAAALLRWSTRPAELFVWTAVTLTAISLVPPLLSAANTATIVALIVLHLVAATMMIPALARPPHRHPQRKGLSRWYPTCESQIVDIEYGFMFAHRARGLGRTPGCLTRERRPRPESSTTR